MRVHFASRKGEKKYRWAEEGGYALLLYLVEGILEKEDAYDRAENTDPKTD